MSATETPANEPRRIEGPVTGPGAWYAREPERKSSWLHPFTDAEIAEIETTLGLALATGKPVTELNRADFPLPTVGSKPQRVVGEVENGRGIALLRGIRLPDYARHEARVIFWGAGPRGGVNPYAA